MIYDQSCVSAMHIKSNTTGGVFLSSCTFKDYTYLSLLKCVCHASLSFIDPFNNPIIKFKVLCLKRVNLFDTCGDVTPFCLDI